MKKQWLPILCSCLLAAALFAACDGVEPQAPSSSTSASSSAAADTSAAEESTEAEPETPLLEGVEGDYVPVPFSYQNNRPTATEGDYIFLAGTVQLNTTLMLMWEISNGGQGPTLVEAIDMETGENLHRHTPKGYAWAIEATGELPEDYRILLQDRIDYRCSIDSASSEQIFLPESIAEELWNTGFAGAPYDYSRTASRWAYTAADGIYIAGQNGAYPRKVLDNADLPALFAQSGKELPAEQAALLHYTAPLLLNGGRHLVASASLLPAGKEPIYFGVSYVELPGGKPEHIAGADTMSAPARRLGGGSVVVPGMQADVSGLAVEFAASGQDDRPDWGSTWDYSNYLRVQSTAEADEPVFELLRYLRAQPDDTEVLLSARVDALYLRAVTDSAALCLLVDDGREQLILVPYTRE